MEGMPKITKTSNPDGIAMTLDAASTDPLKGTQYDFPRDVVGFGRKSFNPKWPNGAKIAVSFVINYEEVRQALKVLSENIYSKAGSGENTVERR
jgi:hypothetical protein